MKMIDVREAKTAFSTLLDQVERGEEVWITREGKVVAKVTSPLAITDKDRAARAADEIRRLRTEAGVRASVDEIRSWIDEGRA